MKHSREQNAQDGSADVLQKQRVARRGGIWRVRAGLAVISPGRKTSALPDLVAIRNGEPDNHV